MLEKQRAPNHFVIYHHQEIQVWFLSASCWMMQVSNMVVSATWLIGETRGTWLGDFCYYFLSSCLGCAVLEWAAGVAKRTSLLLIKLLAADFISTLNQHKGGTSSQPLRRTERGQCKDQESCMGGRALREKADREPRGKSAFSEHQGNFMAVGLLFIKERNTILPMCAFCSEVDATNPMGQ